MRRGFTVLSKSWYGKACLDGRDYTDEVMFGMYDGKGVDTGGTDGEMAVRWYKFSRAARLEVYDDSWAVLVSFADVIKAMGRKNDLSITPGQFAELLVGLGFEDMTQTKPKEK